MPRVPMHQRTLEYIAILPFSAGAAALNTVLSAGL